MKHSFVLILIFLYLSASSQMYTLLSPDGKLEAGISHRQGIRWTLRNSDSILICEGQASLQVKGEQEWPGNREVQILVKTTAL